MVAMELAQGDEGMFVAVDDHKSEKNGLEETITQLENLLEEKEGEIGVLRNRGRILTLKERKSNQELHQLRLQLINGPKQEICMRLIDDELSEARIELINGLKDTPRQGNIGVRRMGDIYLEPFLGAMKSKYRNTEAEIKASETWSLWKEYIRDPEWYPFKYINVNGECQLIIDVEDEYLKTLRENLGDEVHETVIRAVIEINECNSDTITPELWNFFEGKKASLKEGIAAILANQLATSEELNCAKSLAISLAKQLDVKNQMLCELEHKCDDLIAEKDHLHQAFSEEMRKMDFIGLQNIKLERQNDKLKQSLVNQMQYPEQPIIEFDNNSCEIKQEPTCLEIEKERLEPKNCDDDDHSLTIQIKDLKKELADKLEDLESLETLNQILICKERICNDELQDARKEAIKVLRPNLSQRTTLRIRSMGEVDIKPFRELCSGKGLDGGNLDEESAKLCSKWQNEVGNPNWHPFKNVQIDGKLKEIIDEDDDKLKELRNEYGDEAYKAVTNALLELSDYNPSGRYVQAEIWYHKESRKATLKEVIEYMFKQWNNNRFKRKRS